MKKLILLIALMLLPAAAFAQNSLVASPDSLSFAAEGETKSISVTANVKWNRGKSNGANWITMERKENNKNNATLSVTATANTVVTTRTAEIYVICDTCNNNSGLRDTVKVTQQGLPVTLSLDPMSLDFPTTKDTKTVTVTSNDSWTASKSGSTGTNWLDIVSTSGSFTVTAKANNTVNIREAEIIVTSNTDSSVKRTVKVKQAAQAATLTLNPTEPYNIDAGGGSQVVTVTSDVSWAVAANVSWLTFSAKTGSKNGELTIYAHQNTGSARTGTVTFTYGAYSQTKTVEVKQAAAVVTPPSPPPSQALTFTPSTFDFDAQGGSKLVTVTGGPWTASVNAGWLHLSKTSGNGTCQVTFTADPNYTGNARWVYVNFAVNGQAQTFYVSQAAGASSMGLSVYPASLHFEGRGGIGYIDVYAPNSVKWTASVNDYWLTVHPECDNGNGRIAVWVSANDRYVSRYATITVRDSRGNTRTISVTQGTDAKGGTMGNLSWLLYGDTLYISGYGPMPDYGFNETPWFGYNGRIAAVVIRNGVTRIGNYAFADCSRMTYAAIPNSVRSIGYEAFSGCSGLPSITIPHSVTTIGRRAFFSCTGLTFIIIPNSVTSIDEYAFQCCRNLRNVYVGWASPLSISSHVFYDVNVSACTLHVPTGKEQLYGAYPVWRDFYIPYSCLLTVSPSTLNFGSNGESKVIVVTSNTSWKVTENASWLNIWPMSGSGNGSVTVTAAANEGPARSTIVTFSGSDITRTVTAIVGAGPNGNVTVETPEEVLYSAGVLTVNTPVSETVAVYALSGVQVFLSEKASEPAVFRLQGLPQGIYIVRGSSGWVKKIVIG